ncbi:MAG: T9SS C-terminal target domain-containing protein [Bacteroidetes bacterium]|nr:MAG: T9SS C-terminal target domain-containing protein [Bacteroidota bacterium]MBL1143503.1 T9SS C-terminal target domain-containing protein [Bacteroidota bacterium]MCB0802717.1 T9SS type A sorting domain-containing protein [Flavobacteriales bacterium]NOG56306.1 T9SS type A sorting domain-containing protein [Bacteroidota bacterium]
MIVSVHIEKKTNRLIVHHTECSANTIYDIYNSSGQIKLFGFLSSEPKTSIDISQLPKNGYFIQIITKGNVFRKAFKLE